MGNSPVFIMWLVITIIFAVYEMFTFTFITIWFAVGAGVAALLAYFDFHPGYQWAAFAVVTLILLAFTRKLAHKVTGKFSSAGVGSDRSIGMKGIVTEDIEPGTHKGRIRMEKEEYELSASSETGEKISSGAMVEVVRVEGTRMIVRPINQHSV
jgi:membrane protein implicated in regulation of membrane protease activity